MKELSAEGVEAIDEKTVAEGETDIGLNQDDHRKWFRWRKERQ